MPFLSKKIRQLMELLDKKKLPPDLQNVTDAISETAPVARSHFQKDLRKKLLAHHAKLAVKAQEAQNVSASTEQADRIASEDEGTENRFTFKNFFSFKGFATALGILLVLAVTGVASYPLIPAPQVQGFTPKGTVREISYNAPIKIVFDQPMDQKSVEQAFHIEPHILGNFTWANNALLFKPEKTFEIGQEFKVSLAQSAKSFFQKNLAYEYLETFRIVGPPQVLFFSPTTDSKDIPTDAPITIHFDRPITALTTLDQGLQNVPPLEIQPMPKGRFKWLGTDTIQFIPDKLMFGTAYTVTIPKGTKAADGGMTDRDFVFTFETLRPAFVGVSPGVGSVYNGPDTIMKLTFNQMMDIGQATSKIHLFKLKQDIVDQDNKKLNDLKSKEHNSPSQDATFSLGGHFSDDYNYFIFQQETQEKFDPAKFEEVPFNAAFYTAEDYKKDHPAPPEDPEALTEDVTVPDEAELKKTLVLIPSQKLPYDSYFVVKVDKDFKGAEGTLALEQESRLGFKTVGDLKVYLSPETQNNLKKLSGSPEIHFTQPMNEESLLEHLEIEPKSTDPNTQEIQKPSISLDGDKVILWTAYNFKPSTDYTVTIKKGAKSLFGNELVEDFVVKFTSAPLAPDFNVLATGNLSVMEASKPKIFYVKTTNLDHVHVNFKKLSEEEFEKYYQGNWVNENPESFKDFSASWDHKITKKSNETVTSNIDFEKQVGKLEPGFYYFEVSHPDIKWDDKMRIDRYFFAVSNDGLSLKLSQNKLLVWATSFDTGTPIEGMDIEVAASTPDKTDETGGMIVWHWEKKLQGKTDHNGLAIFDLKKDSANDYTNILVYGRKNNGVSVAYSQWNEGVQPWNFQIDYGPQWSKYYAYVYTDRPIYRPGHTVYFKGLLRTQNDTAFTLPDVKKVHVDIWDSMGDKVMNKDVDVNANGTFTGELPLSEQVRTGSYSIALSFPETKDDNAAIGGRSYFMVNEYRKPDYELKVESDKESYINGEKATIKVKASYFFGAPMPNATMYWNVVGQDYFFFLGPESGSKYASEWYSFSDEGYSCYFGCSGDSGVVAQGKTKLDANGEFTIELPLDIAKKKLSQLYSLEVTVVDSNNQSVSNRVAFPVHQGEFYTGITTQDYVLQAGKNATFKIISVDEQGNPVGNKEVEVSFFKREWNTIKKKNVDSDFYYENSFDDTLLEKKTVTTNAEGYAQVSFLPKEGGSFKASVQSKDSRGNVITASTTVYVTSSTFVNWGRENNDRIELVPDKLEYKPGDTAHVLVKSPYQNVYALLTTERNDVLSQKVIQLKSNAETIDIPITRESIPNLFVSVLLVKGNTNIAGLKEPAKKQIDERDIAAFKLGYTTLQVNNSSKKLSIDIQSNAEKYHPGDEVTLKVKSTDIDGKPAKAELSLAVVDKSVLSLTENFTADLLNEFYRKRNLGVLTSDTRAQLLSRINVQVAAGGKGGGGGSNVQTRGEFKDTAYWQAVINTNEQGEGEIKFKLPDNLTTWQVLAIGITPDTLVGSQKKEFVVNKDVVVRPVLPRFLMIEDKLTVGGIVHNYLETAMDFDVSLQASGVTIDGAAQQKIHLNPGENKKVEFKINVQDQQEARFVLTAKAAVDEKIGDSVKMTLPIQSFSFPEVVATSTVLTSDAKHVETIWLPNNIDKNFGELVISVAPTLMGSITKGLDYLVQFPYGCAEQISSALLPNLSLKQMASMGELGEQVKKHIDLKEVDKNVTKGLQALYKAQQPGGGFGLWTTSEKNPYLTAYVLFTLHEAKISGYTVDEKVINNAVGFLRNFLNATTIIDSTTFSSPPKYLPGKNPVPQSKTLHKDWNYNARAFILYVLAEMGQGDLALNNNLYPARDQLNLYAKAYLAMSYDLLRDQQQLDEAVQKDIENKITALKNDILNHAKESLRGVSFENTELDFRNFDTNTRTTALVLQLLTRTDDKNPLVPKILRYLLMERKDGHFASTQETAISLLAFMDYLKASGELEANFSGNVSVNGSSKIQKDFNKQNLFERESVNIPVKNLLLNNQDNEIVAEKDGTGRMYFDVNLKYYLPTEQIEPRDEGITVQQEYFALDDKKEEHPLTTIKVGENVKGKITVIVPKAMYYVMVEDFLPAGLEGLDFTLKTSEQSLELNDQQCDSWDCWSQSWYFNHSEVRDDRMMYFADYLPEGVYEIEYYVRATAPGTFHDLPTLAQETYFPEVFGRSAGRILEVQE